MTEDERKLIGAVQAGDRQAFDTLYGRYAPRVFAFTLQLSGSRADAEDLTQEAFVAAFQGLARFRGQSSLLSWLLGIALRRRRDAQRRPAPPRPDAPAHDGGLADRTADALLLRDALAALPEPQREAFLLVASQGLTHKKPPLCWKRRSARSSGAWPTRPAACAPRCRQTQKKTRNRSPPMHPPYTDEDLTALAAGDLGTMKTQRLRHHLAQCPACRAERDAVQDLWTRAQAAQAVAPPTWLPSRLAAGLPPAAFPPPRRRRAPWKPLTALGAAVGAAFVATLLLAPGSLVRPLSAFAAVERAMQTIDNVSWTETRITYGTGGRVQMRDVQRVWVRRVPPAIATWNAPTFALGPQKTLKDGRGRLTLKLSSGEYLWDRRPRRPIAEQTTALIRSLTDPSADTDFLIGPGLTASAWRQTQAQWHGRRALRFARTVHVHRLMPSGSPLPFHVLTFEARQTIWADARTSRVLQSETQETVGGRPAIDEIKTGFGYDQPPPPGTFDLTPPPGAKVTQR